MIANDIIRKSDMARLGELEKLSVDVTCTIRHGGLGSNVISCSRNPIYITATIADNHQIMYKQPSSGKGNTNKNNEKENVKPIEDVIKILDKISDADAKLMGFNNGTHPRNMILHSVLVIPPIARPPIEDNGTINNNPLTNLYVRIVRANNNYLTSTKKQEAAASLYLSVKQLFDQEDGGKYGPFSDFKSITDLIQGKDKLLRGMLMGKRGNFCGRTVLSPDPSLKFGQLSLPEVWTPVLTKEVNVTPFNKKYLEGLLTKGKITYIIPSRGNSKGLRITIKPGKSYTLYEGDPVKRTKGDTVGRWLEDGDKVIFNRQPTLHRQSMMAYEAVLADRSTIGLHISNTSPHNADFDGDEGNVWNPQSLRVEAEALELMNVKKCIMSTASNKPTMGLVYDAITTFFIMTSNIADPETGEVPLIPDDIFMQCLNLMTNTTSLYTLEARLKQFGVNRRSGKALFSALLPEGFYYSKGEVLITNGILVRGSITVEHIGPVSRSIVQELWSEYGSERTADFITDASWIGNYYLTEFQGLSVGPRDCVSNDPETIRIVKEEVIKVRLRVDALSQGEIDNPLERENTEKEIVGLLRSIKALGTRLAKEVLLGNNAVGIMAKDTGGGGKGALFNVAQMFAMVGQQFYQGRRIEPTITGGTRALPGFDENDTSLEARGFITQSYWKGMTPEGLFFIQAGGREGITDTALKTADTGDIQRKMVKAFETITIKYDGSVRNTNGVIIQTSYGYNGFDVGELKSVRSEGYSNLASFIDIKATANRLNSKHGWIPKKAFEKEPLRLYNQRVNS